MSVFGIILVRILLYSDWIRRGREYLSVRMPVNTGQNNSECGHFSRSDSYKNFFLWLWRKDTEKIPFLFPEVITVTLFMCHLMWSATWIVFIVFVNTFLWEMLKVHGRIKNYARNNEQFVISPSYNLNKLTRYDREEPSHYTHKLLPKAALENLWLLQKIFKNL